MHPTPSDTPRRLTALTIAVMAAVLTTEAITTALHHLPAALTQQRHTTQYGPETLNAHTGEPATALAALLTDQPALGTTIHDTLDNRDYTIELAWNTTATPTDVRVEFYNDHHGTGIRLGLTATADTGPGCIAAELTEPDTAPLVLHTCHDTARQPQVRPGLNWTPDHLFVLQHVTLDVGPTELLVDHLGIGLDFGDAYDSGIWGSTYWEPWTVLDEMNSYHEWCAIGTPVPLNTDGLPPALANTEATFPACATINSLGSMDPQTHHRTEAASFTATGTTGLSQWTRYNDTADQPHRMRLAAVADLRTCDTAPDRCHADTGSTWLRQLTGIDCVHAVGRPCPPSPTP
jgi:hypothetical protein